MRKRLKLGSPEAHGMTGTPTYVSYFEMLKRCYDASVIRYPQYGGRGIGVCGRWRRSFLAFLVDMGKRPPGKTLDRIDVNADYSPENCKWATRGEQASNLQRTRRITSEAGETKTLAEWVEVTAIPQTTFRRYVLDYRLTVEQAIERHKAAA